MAQIFDTIILGAGWSGAVAARELARAGRSVLVLEARDRTGGRARTWTSNSGDAKIDLGCTWIHGYNEGNPARAIAAELKVPAHLPKAAPSAMYGPNGVIPKEEAAKLSSSLGAAVGQFKTPHPSPESTASLADALFGANSPLAAASDTTLARGLARTLEVPLGLKLERASLRWAGWESATSFSGSDAAPEGGYEALISKVLAEATAAGAKIQLSEPAEKIVNGDKDVVVTTADGKYTARTLICTIPLGVLKTASSKLFEPALPARLTETIAGVNVGVLEKFLLRYPSAWWPKDIGGFTFLPTNPDAKLTSSSSIAEVLAASTIITASFAAGTLPGPSPTLLSYLSDTPARALLAHKPEDVAAAFHTFLVSRLQPTEAPPAPTEFALTNWLTDPLSLGATTTPSVVSENGERSPMDFKELSRPLWDGRLGFAGEHTEMENRGSVAGAVLSGQREAARVDRLLAKSA